MKPTAAILRLPVAKAEKKRLVQAEVNLELRQAVEAELERQGITWRAAVEYGLTAWLLAVNPEAAKRFARSERG